MTSFPPNTFGGMEHPHPFLSAADMTGMDPRRVNSDEPLRQPPPLMDDYNGMPSMAAQWDMNPMEAPLGPPGMGAQGMPQHQKVQQGAYVSHYPGPPIQTSKNCQGPDGCNLFIFHIPNDLTNLDLYNLFVPFGNVISARIMVENETGRSRGFGFVSFDNRISADNAIKSMNGYQIGRKRLKVQHKKERHDIQQGYPAMRVPHPAYLAQQQYPPMAGQMPPGFYMPRGPMQQQPRQSRRKGKGNVAPGPQPPRGARGYDGNDNPDPLLLESALSSLSLDDFNLHTQPAGSDGSHEDEQPAPPLHQASPTSILPTATVGTYDPWGATTAFMPPVNAMGPSEAFQPYDFNDSALEAKSASAVSEQQIRELQERIKEQSAMLQGQTELLQHLLSAQTQQQHQARASTPDEQGDQQ